MGLSGVAFAVAVLALIKACHQRLSPHYALVIWFSSCRDRAVGRARSFLVIYHFLALAISLLYVALGIVTYASFQTTPVEQKIEEELTDMFKDPKYAEMDLTLEGVTVNYKPEDLLLKDPVMVPVLVGRRACEEVPPD